MCMFGKARTSALEQQLLLAIKRGDTWRAMRCLRRLPDVLESETIRFCVGAALHSSICVLEELLKRVSQREQIGN